MHVTLNHHLCGNCCDNTCRKVIYLSYIVISNPWIPRITRSVHVSKSCTREKVSKGFYFGQLWKHWNGIETEGEMEGS